MNNIEVFNELFEAVTGEKPIIDGVNQALYPKPEWAVKQIVRDSGLVEDICRRHGVGHPNKEWLKLHDPDGKRGFGVHGCCGCCNKKINR